MLAILDFKMDITYTGSYYITNGCVDPSCVCLHTKTCLYVVVWKLRN